MRRALIIFLGVISFTIAAVGSVQLYSRIGGPDFKRGGAFGPQRTTAGGRPTASPSLSSSSHADSGVTPTPTAHTSASSSPRASTTAPSSVAPAAGTYTYASHGHETVHVGSTSPCSWDLSESTLAIKRDGSDYVLDWNYSPRRQQRLILNYRPTGIYTLYAGAAVTCLGFQKTDQGDYSPAARRMLLPAHTGGHWLSVATTQDRTERIEGRIVSHKKVSVPAGTFDAYQVRIHVTISGSQTGTVDQTSWFAPALGIDVSVHAVTDATNGSAQFNSDITLQLRKMP